MQAPPVLRLVATPEGRCKVNFTDNTVVCFDAVARSCGFRPGASSSGVAGPSGPSISSPVLLDYVTHLQASYFKEGLRLYNSLMEGPVIARCLHDPAARAGSSAASSASSSPASVRPPAEPRDSSVLATGHAITSCRWHATPAEASAAGAVEFFKDGSVSLDSADGAAHCLLSPGADRLTVTFPLLCGRNPASLRFEHLWTTQQFPTFSVPAVWRRALTLARCL
jgi:hypothetical protein